MKTSILISILFFATCFSYGQLKVTSDGKVGIGSSNSNLFISGENASECLNIGYGIMPIKIYPLGNAEIGAKRPWMQYGSAFKISPLMDCNTLEIQGSPAGAAIAIETDPDCSVPAIMINNNGWGHAFTSSSGNFGSYNFYLTRSGDVYSKSVKLTSDITLKEDIATIETPLSKVLQLRGVTFRWKDDEAVKMKKSKSSFKATDNKLFTEATFNQQRKEDERKEMGLIAQEVEKVVPEVVRTSDNGTKTVAYAEMIGLLIEAIKEQQTQIGELQQQIKELENPNNGNASKQKTKSFTDKTDLSTEPLLEQNTPNPFSTETIIRYYLPESTIEASVIIYDNRGTLIENIALNEKGNGSVVLQKNHLQPGTYIYTLKFNGKEIDSKRMIIY